ncbi:hypothetical protein [Streptococcus plurextorum]|uniref:hypothetical protein n=1 Tax=Streptococcus plurextorum TaxID=456876 RepID=UPI0003FCCE40|nr:hypothetical protein [Streptococcus plurextorum]
MQLIIENKTFVPQLVWLSLPDDLREEIIILKSREIFCVEKESLSTGVSVWDRSQAYDLGARDKRRMSKNFRIYLVKKNG